MGGCFGNKPKSGDITKPLARTAQNTKSVVSLKSSAIWAETEDFINDKTNSMEAKEDFLKSNLSLYLKHHSAAVTSIVISPDSKTLISSSIDKTVKLWDLENLKQTAEISHDLKVNQASITPDGRSIFTLSGNRAISQWDSITLTQQNLFTDFKFRIQSFSISPNGKELFLGGSFIQGDNCCPIHTLSIDSGKLKDKGFNGHRAAASALIFTSDKRFMISSSGGHYVAVQDNSVRLWSVSSKKNLATYSNFDEAVNCIAVANTKECVVAGSKDRSIHLLDFKLQKTAILRGHEASIETLAVPADERLLVSGSMDSTLRVWDLEKHSMVHQLKTSAVFSLACYDSYVFAGCMCNIKRVDLRNFEEEELQGHNGKIDIMSIPSKSKYLLTAANYGIGGDGTVRIWNMETQKQEKVIKFPERTSDLRNLDESKILCFYHDGL